MNKKIFLLILGLALTNVVFADLSFSFSLNSSETLKVFTSQYIADQAPKPDFRDTLVVLSSFPARPSGIPDFRQYHQRRECSHRKRHLGYEKNHFGHGLRQGADHPRRPDQDRL